MDDQCLRCARSRQDGTCSAFPEGIPHEIFSGEHDHKFPFDGDGGLMFVERTYTFEDSKLAYPPDGLPE